MKLHLLSATSLVTTLLFLVPGAAQAVDTWDWSGGYVGAEVGGDAALESIHLFDFANQSTSPSNISFPTLGPSGTIVAGYNWQNDQMVFGIEGDGTVKYVTGNQLGDNYSANAQLYGLLSLRGRFGFTNGSTFVYGTAGVAAGYGKFGVSTSVSGSSTPALGAGIVMGPTAGIGVEHAINDNVTLTAEGLVTNLGTLHAVGDNGKGAYHASGTTTDFSLRGGVKYHF